MTTRAKFWLLLFVVPYLVCAALLVQTLFTPIPFGDLSRLGRIDEYEFGWHRPPPHVDAQWLRAAPIDKADILVLGDSFSGTHRWQSRLTQAGYAVTTIFWSDVDESLCGDFDDWIAKAGFRGKLVIVESVERFAAERVQSTRECGHMRESMRTHIEPSLPTPDSVPGTGLNWDAQLVSGWLTARCTRAAIDGRKRSDCNDLVQALPVPDGCSLFTHRRCDMALFLTDDTLRGEIPAQAVATMQAFTQAQRRVPILWMMVPNKTTAYLQPGHSQAFARALAQSGLGPDLFAFAQAGKTSMRDFYFPNDTHLSMHGQLALGDLMLKAVRQKLEASAAAAAD